MQDVAHGPYNPFKVGLRFDGHPVTAVSGPQVVHDFLLQPPALSWEHCSPAADNSRSLSLDLLVLSRD